jgi:hypothetical protein
MSERRSISIEPELHAKILKFRAFFMSHGIDVPYTRAFNFLAEYGYDVLQRSGFNAELLERLDSRVALDLVTVEAISHDWLEGKMPGFPAGAKGPAKAGGPGEAARTVATPPRAQTQPKEVQGYCVKCKASRQMKDTLVITTKNGRHALQGRCAVCGTKMINFRIPR